MKRGQHHLVGFKLRLNQRHAQQLTLGQKLALLIDHHLGTVKLKTCLGQYRLLYFDSGA